jgi:hypothetical protein
MQQYSVCPGCGRLIRTRYPTAPPDIAQACIELVCQRYRERSRIGDPPPKR